jgi:hypothetical protein
VEGNETGRANDEKGPGQVETGSLDGLFERDGDRGLGWVGEIAADEFRPLPTEEMLAVGREVQVGLRQVGEFEERA